MSVALGITLLLTPTYESRAEMTVFVSGGATTGETYQGSLFSQQRVAAYSGLVTSDVILSKALADLALELSPSQLADKVTTSIARDPDRFDVVVTDGSPELARDIANTVALQLTAVVSELEAPEGGGVSSVGVKIIKKAEADHAPIHPNTAEYLAIGAAVGLLIGTAVVIVRRRIRGR